MPDEVIANSQRKLNIIYDKFVNEYGYINSKANMKAFEKDNSINLLASLENLTVKRIIKANRIFLASEQFNRIRLLIKSIQHLMHLRYPFQKKQRLTWNI